MTLARRSPSITPFWYRIPRFFLYPIRLPAIWLLLGVTTLVTVALPMLDGLLSIPLVLFLAFLVFTYCYESLDATAQGNAEPPGIREVLASGGWGLPLKQIAVLFTFGAFGAIATAILGDAGTLVIVLLFNLLLPASVMVLGVERSFMAAVNPLYLGHVVRAIGWPYLGLIGLLFAHEIALGTAMVGVAWILPEGTGPLPYVAGWTLVGVYFTVMSFHMLGYVVYQYHAELGYTVHVDGDEEDELTAELAFFDQLIADERYEAALIELREVMERYPDDINLHQRMFRLAGLTGDVATRLREGDWLIHRLVRGGRAAAAHVYRQCIAVKADFRPLAAEVHDPLARELRMNGKVREAVQLINGFHLRFPGHHQIPRIYLLAAQIFIDEIKQPKQAEKILAYIRRKHPDSAYHTQVESLLRTLAADPPA
ncbi:MAG: hypothetical protein WED00_12080 [Aquisalimonadaceae bacterium]